MKAGSPLEQTSPLSERLGGYFKSESPEIEGWLQARLHRGLVAVQELHDRHKVTGGMLEIGVHHGKFFLALGFLRRPDEPWVAVDLFEEQVLNIDRSGRGNLDRFMANLRKIHPGSEPPVLLKGDSTVLRIADYQRALQGSAVRLFSIDGGHTAEHAMHDLKIASQLVCNGAVVFLDDFFNDFWPGVSEGFYRYMSYSNTNLCPFAYSSNKLFLTTLAYHKRYFEYFCERFKATEILRAKQVRICGFDVLSLRYGRHSGGVGGD